MVEKTQKYKKVVLEAPEGGWGYFICVAAILVNTIIPGILGCFGILYKESINKMELGTSTVVLITGTNYICASLTGFLTSPFLKVLTFRRLALVACVLYNVGCLGTVFANSIVPFFIFQSLLQGAGMGIFFTLTVTILNEYFVKKLLFATGIYQSSAAILSMGFPILLNTIYNYYGYRGSLLIVSALSMHLFIAVALMQPVKRHLKKRELPEFEGEIKSLLEKDIESDGIPIVKVIHIDSLSTTIDKNEKEDVKKLPSIHKEDSAVMNVFKECFDVYLLKSFLPSYAGLGLVMAIFADFVTTMLLPQILYAANWSQENTAFAMSMMAFGDLFSRLVLIFGSKYIKLKSKQLHMIGVVIGIFPRIGLLVTKNEIATLVQLFVLGVGRCFLITILHVIISDNVPPEKFTAAIGISMLSSGICNLSLGAAAGAVRDLTGSYDTIIWISIVFLLLTIIQGLLETFCLKRSRNKLQEK